MYFGGRFSRLGFETQSTVRIETETDLKNQARHVAKELPAQSDQEGQKATPCRFEA